MTNAFTIPKTSSLGTPKELTSARRSAGGRRGGSTRRNESAGVAVRLPKNPSQKSQ